MNRSLPSLKTYGWILLGLTILLTVSYWIVSQMGGGKGFAIAWLPSSLDAMGLWLFCLRMMAIGLFVGVCWTPIVHRLMRHHADYPACAHHWQRHRWTVAMGWIAWDVFVVENLVGSLMS
jgi:hypothetical protein